MHTILRQTLVTHPGYGRDVSPGVSTVALSLVINRDQAAMILRRMRQYVCDPNPLPGHTPYVERYAPAGKKFRVYYLWEDFNG